VAALQGRAADLDQLRRLPAVAADERRADAEVAGLLRDLPDVGVVAGHEDDLRVRRLDRGELRAEVGVAVRVAGPGDDLAAVGREALLEVLAEIDGVV